MGNINTCCCVNSNKNPFSNAKTQTEISVDVSNSTPNTHLSRTKILFKPAEVTDHSSTSITSTNLKPKRNRSSIVLTTNKFRMPRRDSDLKRSNSALEEVSAYKIQLEERLCAFSKNKQLNSLHIDEEDESNNNYANIDNQSQITEVSKVINLIQCPVADNNDNSPSPYRKSKTRKSYEVINEPLSEKQLSYIKRILFEEEILIDEMDDATM